MNLACKISFARSAIAPSSAQSSEVSRADEAKLFLTPFSPPLRMMNSLLIERYESLVADQNFGTTRCSGPVTGGGAVAGVAPD